MAVQVASLFASVGADLSPLNKGLSKASVALGTFAGNMMTGVVQVLARAGQALAGVGVEAVSLAADFEKQMAILSIAAKSSGETFDSLHDAAIAVGGDARLLGVSATGAADAMTGLYKAGLTTTEIFGDLNAYMEDGAELGGALRAAIDLAAATELDMVQASDLAAVALATFGGELETAEERAQFINDAMNNMVKAADASVAEVSDLADALSTIGPTAAAFGFTLEDTNNALALLSTRGIAGAEAGTALKSMMTNMMRQTGKTIETWQDLGLSMYDAEGQMKDLPTIIGELSQAMAGMSEEQKNVTIQQLAGTYGMKALQTLLAEGTAGWDAMALATENASGIQEQAAAQAATFSGQMEALDGTLETLKITLGEALLPYLTEFASWASEWVGQHGPALAAGFTAIVDGLIAFGQYIANVVTEGDVLNDWLTQLPEGIQPLVQKLGELVIWFRDTIPPAMAAVAETWNSLLQPALQGLWSFIQDNLLVVLAAMAPIWVPIVAGMLSVLVPIALLGAALVALGLFWQEHAEQVKVTLEQLKLIIFYALNAISVKLAEWKAQLGVTWDQIKLIIFYALNEASQFLMTFIQTGTAAWSNTWTNFKIIAETLWSRIVTFLQTTWNNIQTGISTSMNTIKTTITSLMSGIQQAWANAWNTFKGKVTGAWDAIKSAVKNAAGKVKSWIQGVIDKLNSVRLPGWLTGHSPPPLADWFNDIADAMDNAAHAKMPKLNASVGVTHTVASSPMAGGAAVGGGLVINILGPVTVRDDRDIDMIADRIAKRMKLKGHTGYRLGTV